MWKDNSFKTSFNDWPMNTITDVRPITEEVLYQTLKNGKYGRCVYCCDNNVVDNQTTILEFEEGVVATMKMVTLVKNGGRVIKIYGSQGEVEYNEVENKLKIQLYFGENYEYSIPNITETHGSEGKNRDERMLDDFLKIVSNFESLGNNSTNISFEENHFMAMAAEESRLNNGKVIDLAKFRNGDSVVKYIIDYIEDHYLEDITINSVAKSLRYSVGYCSRIIKNYSGYNFRDYLNKKRLKKAEELIADKTLNMTWLEIIYSCGFNCPSTYYRAKKKLS